MITWANLDAWKFMFMHIYVCVYVYVYAHTLSSNLYFKNNYNIMNCKFSEHFWFYYLTCWWVSYLRSTWIPVISSMKSLMFNFIFLLGTAFNISSNLKYLKSKSDMFELGKSLKNNHSTIELMEQLGIIKYLNIPFTVYILWHLYKKLGHIFTFNKYSLASLCMKTNLLWDI